MTTLQSLKLAILLILTTMSPVWGEDSRPVVIAHRGASGYLPEHTLEAKCLAYGFGADYLEQDVVLSRDDVPIVSHDIHLDRVTDIAARFPDRARADGRFYAIDFDWREIQQLTVTERLGNSGKAAFPQRFPMMTGRFRIASLAEELALIGELNRQTGRHVGIYPELKQPAFHQREGKDISRIVLGVLAEHGYVDASQPCFLQCFEWDELVRVKRELHCKLPLVYLVSRDRKWDALLQDERALHQELTQIADICTGLGPQLTMLLETRGSSSPQPTPLIKSAHAAGLKVHGWTLRAEELSSGAKDFKQLHTWIRDTGIDGCFSDFPDQTLGYWSGP